MKSLLLLLVIFQLRVTTTRMTASIEEAKAGIVFLLLCVGTSIWLTLVERKDKRSKEEQS